MKTMDSLFLISWPTFFAFFATLFGLVLGSFGNVVIYRVPSDQSVVSPPSACPACGTPIRWFDNIPVLSWLVLGGKCRSCKASISYRYPLVEAATGAAFGWTAWWFASHGDYWVIPAMLVFTWAGIVLSMIDLDTRRLPNPITYPLAGALVVLLGGAAILNGEPSRIVNAVIGGLGAFAFLFLLNIVSKGGMGMGDVKYAPSLGMVLGYVSLGSVLIGFFAAFALGAIISVGLMALGLRTRKDMVPFGPFLTLGTWVSLFIGPTFFEWYLGTMG